MDYKNSIETQLENFVPENSLSEVVKYSLLGGGKRFRGSLCYLIAEMFGVDIKKVHSSSCSLEMIHAYSLIHDDLPAMDNDDFRRGKPTSHKQFDEASAILAGDGLQTLAFKIITSDDSIDDAIKIQLLQTLTTASFDMVLGQQLDMQSGDNITLKELEQINRLKTGALLIASVKMGGILAKVDDKTAEILTNFATYLAKAYQVQDDSFDGKKLYEIGKSNNSDKTTFVDLLGLEQAVQHYQDLYDNASKELQKINGSEKLQELVTLIKHRKF